MILVELDNVSILWLKKENLHGARLQNNKNKKKEAFLSY
jgi:hypothetical protein